MVEGYQQAINDNLSALSDEHGFARSENAAGAESLAQWDPFRLIVNGQIDPDLGGMSADCSELRVRFDPRERILWCHMNQTGRPSFNPGILSEFDLLRRRLHTLFDNSELSTEQLPRYLVLGSQTKSIFSFGGDLRLIAQLRRDKDRARLRQYARACVDTLYPYIVGFNLPLVTITLVQGDALGGGFEAAVSGNIVVAEEGVKFGLPEILFNLFPGMGAYSVLARKIGPMQAERLIMSGHIYTARELHEMGVVDMLAEPGAGEQTIYNFAGTSARRFNAQFGIYKSRERVWQVSHDELCDIADIWVDAALGLTESDLGRIDRLAEGQDRKLRALR
jgi:DSF synthase